MTIGTLLLPRRIDLAPAAPTQWLPDIGRLGLAVLLISAAYCAGGIVGLLLATILAALVEERRRTRASLRSVQADLAHAARVTVMGELAAAIAREVNQPLTAIVANAQACLRRIAAGSLEPRELREVLHDIVDDGPIRAGTARAASWSTCATLGRGSTRRTSRSSSTGSIRRSPVAWAWGCP